MSKPETRIKIGFGVKHQNPDDVYVEHRQDVAPILDLNQFERINCLDGRPGGYRPVARIPVVIMEKLRAMGIAPDQDYEAFKYWLEMNPKFKTTEKKMWRPKRKHELRNPKT